MASTGKKGKKNKGKTVHLNDFLSNTSMSWSDQVEEADKLGEFNRKPALPAAPRAARALEIDESRIPKNPPYVAYLSNLSYELEEADILNSFSDLSIANVRLPRDEHSGRMKGFGYVEFNDRSSFISALQKHEATIRGRRIKIDIAEHEGERRKSGMRDNRERKSNYDPEKTLGDWRSGPRSELTSADDRRGTTFGRKEYSGFRDKDNFEKSRGDKETSWRDNERRYGNDRDSRSSYGSRRNYEDGESNYEPKTRAKLNLKPRTLPIENIVIKDELSVKEEERREQDKPSSASIFGQAKPVDTAAREREIELRLEKEREVLKSEKDTDKTKNNEEYSSSEAKEYKSAPGSKENLWIRKSQKSDAQDIYQGPNDEKTSDLDEPLPDNDSQRNISENLEEFSGYDAGRKNEDYDDNYDIDGQYGRQGKNDNRCSEKGRDVDKGYRKDEKWRDDRDRRGRRDYETRDRGYDFDRRIGNNGGRGRETERDSDSKRFSEKDNDSKRFIYDKDNDWRKNAERDGDSKRFQDRDSGRHRDQEDHGSNKGSRGDRRSGFVGADKGSRQVKSTQDRGPQPKDRSRDQKKFEDGIRMPKFKEASTPNYVGLNKYSFLEEDGASE